MLGSSNRQIYVFNKRGDKVACLDLQPLYYLETEKEWIQKRLNRSDLDGMAFIIDWDKREIIWVRYADTD